MTRHVDIDVSTFTFFIVIMNSEFYLIYFSLVLMLAISVFCMYLILRMIVSLSEYESQNKIVTIHRLVLKTWKLV